MAQERDPFISVLDLEKEKQKAKVQVTKKIDLSQFALNGIIWNEKMSVAIINDELFVAGDDCKGLGVKSIEKDGVMLTDGTDSFKVPMTDDILPTEKKQLAKSLATPPPEEAVGETPLQQEKFVPQEQQGPYPGTSFRPPSQGQGRAYMPPSDNYDSYRGKR